MVQGGRWGGDPKVELSRLGDGAVAQPGNTVTLTPFQSSKDALKFLIPASWRPGAYRLQVTAGSMKSAPWGDQRTGSLVAAGRLG